MEISKKPIPTDGHDIRWGHRCFRLASIVLAGRFSIDKCDDLANEIGKTIKAWLKKNGLE